MKGDFIKKPYQSLKVFQSSLYQTNSIVYSNEQVILIIDPCWLPNEIEAIRNYFHEMREKQEVILIFTHSDFDHIIGYGAFQEAKVIASKAFAGNSNKEKCVQEILDFDDEYYVQRNYEIEYPKVDIEIVEDGQQLSWGETTFSFYLAPGHTADGIFIVLEEENVIIAGDYLSDIEFPFIYDKSSNYLETMLKIPDILDKHNINYLIPGHGGLAKNREEILRRQRESMQYIQELRTSIQNGFDFDTEALLNKYPFPKNLLKSHEHNLQLTKKELGHLGMI